MGEIGVKRGGGIGAYVRLANNIFIGRSDFAFELLIAFGYVFTQ